MLVRNNDDDQCAPNALFLKGRFIEIYQINYTGPNVQYTRYDVNYIRRQVDFIRLLAALAHGIPEGCESAFSPDEPRHQQSIACGQLGGQHRVKYTRPNTLNDDNEQSQDVKSRFSSNEN